MKYSAVIFAFMLMLLAVNARENVNSNEKEKENKDSNFPNTTDKEDMVENLKNINSESLTDTTKEAIDNESSFVQNTEPSPLSFTDTSEEETENNSKNDSPSRRKRDADNDKNYEEAANSIESTLEDNFYIPAITTISPVITNFEEKEESVTTKDSTVTNTDDVIVPVNNVNSTSNSMESSKSTSVSSSTLDPINVADDSIIIHDSKSDEQFDKSIFPIETKNSDDKETIDPETKDTNTNIDVPDQTMSETIALKNLDDLNKSTPSMTLLSTLNPSGIELAVSDKKNIANSDDISSSSSISRPHGAIDKREHIKTADTDMDTISIIHFPPLYNESATVVFDDIKPVTVNYDSSSLAPKIDIITDNTEGNKTSKINTDLEVNTVRSVTNSVLDNKTATINETIVTNDINKVDVKNTTATTTITTISTTAKTTTTTTTDTLEPNHDVRRTTESSLVNELTSEKSIQSDNNNNTTGGSDNGNMGATSAGIVSQENNYDYIVYNDTQSIPCILASMDVILSVSYDTVDNKVVMKKMQVPGGAIVSGKCGEKISNLTLTWNEGLKDGQENSISFQIAKDEDKFYVSRVYARIFMDEDDVPSNAESIVAGNSSADLRLFSASIKNGIHVCHSVTEVQCGKIVVTIKDISLIAYNDKQDTSYRKEEHCNTLLFNLHAATIVGGGVGIIVILAIIVMLIWFKNKSSSFKSELP